MTISRHPEPCADPRPFLAVGSTCDSSFRATYPPAVSPTGAREELDPCSLDPAALFGARLPSVFEVGRRLPTSATTIRRAGNQTRALAVLAGREASTSILFVHAALPLLRERRHVASRAPSIRVAPVSVCPTFVGLPNRDATATASPPGIAPAVHREDRRARVEGPSEGRVPERMRRCLVPATGACALWRMPTAFPSSAVFGHPLSPARLRRAEDTAARSRTDRGLRSDDAPRRAPPSRKPGCLSPSRTRRIETRRDRSLRPSCRLLAHAAHTFSPGWGRCS